MHGRVDLVLRLEGGCDNLLSEGFHTHVEEEDDKDYDDCAGEESSNCGCVFRLATVANEGGVGEEVRLSEEVVKVMAE